METQMPAIQRMLFLALIVLASATYAPASSIDEILNPIIGETQLLRMRINGSRHFYLNDKWDTHWSFSDARSHLYSEHLPVTLLRFGGLDGEPSGIWIEYEEEIVGIQTIEIQGPPDSSELARLLPSILGHIFVDPTTEENYTYFAREIKSGLTHTSLCNHLPSQDLLEKTNELGNSPSSLNCAICFRPIYLIEGYGAEIALGKQVQNQYRALNRIIEDPELAVRLQTTGNLVLEKWPLPLFGYKYEFLVTEGDSPNACACPGGTIFVNRGLIDAFHDDRELEVVLAHEIAHVEMRHGLTQLKKSQKSGVLNSIGAVLAGVAIGAATEDAATGAIGAAAFKVLADISSSISLSGYSQNNELNADILTRAYLDHNQIETDLYEKVLKGIEYYRGSYHGQLQTPELASHPATGARIKAFQTHKIQWVNDLRLEKRNDAGLVMYTLIPRFFVQAAFPGTIRVQDDFGEVEYIKGLVPKTYFVFEIDAHRSLGFPREFKDLTVKMRTNNGSVVKIRFDHEFDPIVFPNSRVCLMFEANEFEFNEHTLVAVTVNLYPDRPEIEDDDEYSY